MVRLEASHDYRLPRWLKRLQRAESPPPPKTALAGLFLLAVGVVLLTIGLYEKWYDVGPKEPGHHFALFLLSLVTFVPGAWSTTVLWGAFRRWP
eukprot:CAMPEP_0119292490 /NCGR_PEP_ID=MMETSP1329-20130426/44247_1 /TAXON_ID=114041 /ORGANISM="Genus nov. species nov., Strain RCC1024" /LENGTH=93 /DNA_ID=CAMNT_0007293331 /DNA_START=328 /DNA_END=605 /DNA_ORIENTATION=-